MCVCRGGAPLVRDENASIASPSPTRRPRLCAPMYACLVRRRIRALTHVCMPCEEEDTRINTCAPMYMCVYHICIYVYMYICIYIYMYMYM